MASPGDEIIIGPGQNPPPAPKGFHWEVKQVIFSDTGGATIWVLVADVGAGLPTWGDLISAFNAGINALQLGGGFGSAKAHQTIVFNGTTSPWKTSWSPDEDLFIVGCFAQAGQAVSLSGNWANFAAIQASATGIVPDLLLMIPSSSSLGGSGWGDCEIPVAKGTVLWVYGNVAGSLQLFFKPQTTK